MTGVEIVAAVVSIIAGFAACAKYANQISEKMKRKRALADAVGKAEGLDRALRVGLFTVKEELHKLESAGSSVGSHYGLTLEHVVT